MGRSNKGQRKMAGQQEDDGRAAAGTSMMVGGNGGNSGSVPCNVRCGVMQSKV
jgi:hypothetical protein